MIRSCGRGRGLLQCLFSRGRILRIVQAGYRDKAKPRFSKKFTVKQEMYGPSCILKPLTCDAMTFQLGGRAISDTGMLTTRRPHRQTMLFASRRQLHSQILPSSAVYVSRVIRSVGTNLTNMVTCLQYLHSSQS